ncbi:unnamed protein product, partial [Staurois parvus]
VSSPSVLSAESLVIPVLSASLWSSLCCPQSLVITVLSAVYGHPCAVRSLWSIPVSLSAVSGSFLYCVCSQQSSPILSAVSGHLLYCVRSLWSSPV